MPLTLMFTLQQSQGMSEYLMGRGGVKPIALPATLPGLHTELKQHVFMFTCSCHRGQRGPLSCGPGQSPQLGLLKQQHPPGMHEALAEEQLGKTHAR